MSDLPEGKNRRVLIIDDNRAIHEDFRKILAPASLTGLALETEEGMMFGTLDGAVHRTEFEVDSAWQGEEGALLAQKALEAGLPYALAFVDVRMPPGWDGVETSRKLWELDPNLQIVLCTAYSDYSWDEMFEKLGHRDGLLLLKKPFDIVAALQMAEALTEKWWLRHQVHREMGGLEGRVAERTRELRQSNQALHSEVADHQRAEETLRQSEQQLRVQSTALDAAANAIVITDHNGLIQSVNPAFTALTGYTAQEVAGQNPRLLKSGKQDEAFYRKLWQTISSGKVWSGELINRRKDGSFYAEEMKITPLRNDQGVVTRYIAIKQDIAERKRMEETLRASQQVIEGIINAIPVRVFWKDKNLVYLGCNAVFARDAGFADPKDIIGKDDYQMGWRDQAELYRADDQHVIESGCSKLLIEEPQTTPEGNTITLLSSKIPLRGSNGEISGMIGTYLDITERKQAEDALRKIKLQLVHAMKLADLVAWTYDMASGLFTFDDTYYALHGTTAKLEGGNLMSAEVFTREFVHPDDAHVVAEEIGKAVAASDPDYHSQLEHRIFRRGGEIRHVIVHIAITKDAAGRTIQIQGANQDITERKRLEAQLFQSQKMETVGKLAGGVAHEFNSILTAIIGQSELLLNDLPAGSPLFKNATEINRAADRAAALTRQLLAYGRKQMLQPESLDLNQVVAGMDGMFRHLMGGDVVTHVVAAPGLRAVKADAGQVEQVIMNLAMNARDAMPNGGQLTLETANISFDKESVERYPELKAGDYVMLAVTDTGAGMSEKVKARVFEPFFTTKEVGQGSGLGLSTCYGIIKQSGGHISVYSEPGRGATFKVYLPQMAPEAKIPIQSLAAPDMPRGTETILLVEDDPALREMAATLLGRLGYKVWSAANGIEALSLKQQQGVGHIDLLFTDVVMPHMSGTELAGRMRAVYPHTRILFTSAYTENAIIHQGVLEKGVELLQKPFTPSALARKLREVLDRQASPQPDAVRQANGFTQIIHGGNTP